MRAAGTRSVGVRVGGVEPHVVPATIAGHNLEVTEKNVLGMLSNRLENAKFVGPADANGIAPPWRASQDFVGAALVEVDPGVSLSAAGSSQMMLSYRDVSDDRAPELLQTHRQVRAGETLEAVIWAKSRHSTATLEISLRPVARRGARYASGRVVVDSPYWKRYVVNLDIPRDDDQAVLGCKLLGAGRVWIDQIQLRQAGEGTTSAEMLERLGTLRVPVLRFPGGCLAANYRWVHGTGPVEHRPSLLDTANRRLLNYDFGTDEYLDLCRAFDIMPHITVNIGTGTPAEAADWASYIARWYRDRGEEPPAAYFQIGNEDNGVHEHSNMTPEMYTSVLREYAPAIRAAYPAARLVALAERYGHTLDTDQAPWRSTLLPVAKELGIEVLVVHLYKMAPPEDEYAQHTHAIASVGQARRELEGLVEECRAAGLDCHIGVTEWNYWKTASHFDGPKAYERSGATMQEYYDASHVLFAAGMIHTFAELAPDFELGNFYHLVNGMGVFEHRGVEVHDSAMADLFRLYAEALPAQRRTTEVTSEQSANLGVGSLCLVDDRGSTWLFLVNEDPSEPVEVHLEGVDRHPVESRAIAAGRPGEAPTPCPPPTLDGDLVVLPPLSITRLKWGR